MMYISDGEGPIDKLMKQGAPKKEEITVQQEQVVHTGSDLNLVLFLNTLFICLFFHFFNPKYDQFNYKGVNGIY